MRVQLAAALFLLSTIAGATFSVPSSRLELEERSLQDATETPSAAPATAPTAGGEDPFADSSDDPDANGGTTTDAAAASAGQAMAGSILSTGLLAAGMQLMW